MQDGNDFCVECSILTYKYIHCQWLCALGIVMWALDSRYNIRCRQSSEFNDQQRQSSANLRSNGRSRVTLFCFWGGLLESTSLRWCPKIGRIGGDVLRSQSQEPLLGPWTHEIVENQANKAFYLTWLPQKSRWEVAVLTYELRAGIVDSCHGSGPVFSVFL